MERLLVPQNQTAHEAPKLTVTASKSGLPTAIAGGRYIHSAYDPEKEAQRFSLQAGRFPPGSVVLLLGEALGYLSRKLLSDNPGIRLLAVYCSAYFYDNRPAGEPQENEAWKPDGPERFAAFLSRNICDLDFPALRVVEWEPAADTFPLLFSRLREDVSRFGRQVNGSILTTAMFGKKWITNTLRNFLAIDQGLVPRRLAGPVCVAASGPGLEEALPFLRRHRQAFTLMALPSSLDFLRRSGIEPEGLIMTDPGVYTGLHFRGASRRRTLLPDRSIKLCMPLSAYAGVRGKGFTFCLFHQGTLPEAALLRELGQVLPYIPSNGTVSGTAVQIALSLGDGPVILLGMDMAARGIEEHSRPNAFDEFYTEKDCRLKPEEGLRALRMYDMYPDRLAGAWRTSPSLRTYTGWFSSMAEAWKGRVFRISPSPVDTGCVSSYAEAEKLLGEPPAFTFEKLRLPALRERKERAVFFIETLKDSLDKELSGETAQLLFMADSRAVLELKKSPAGGEAGEKLRQSVTEFCAFLYALAAGAAE